MSLKKLAIQYSSTRLLLLQIYCNQPHFQPDLAFQAHAFQSDFQVHAPIWLRRISAGKVVHPLVI